MASLVSQEIETDFFRRRFSKSREVPEVADLSIVAGGGVVCRVRSLTSGRECVLGVGEVAGVCGGGEEASLMSCELLFC